MIIGYIVLLWLVANKCSDTEWGDDTSKVNRLPEFTVTFVVIIQNYLSQIFQGDL